MQEYQLWVECIIYCKVRVVDQIKLKIKGSDDVYKNLVIVDGYKIEIEDKTGQYLCLRKD